MARPRKAPADPWTIYVPHDLATKLDLLFLNPVSGKTVYGYRSNLTVKLLREWLDKRIVEVAGEALDT